jgi:hypothetical protein
LGLRSEEDPGGRDSGIVGAVDELGGSINRVQGLAGGRWQFPSSRSGDKGEDGAKTRRIEDEADRSRSKINSGQSGTGNGDRGEVAAATRS